MPYGQDYQDDPFTGPYLKALKIRQYLKDQAYQDEHRQMLREQMKLQLDEARRQRTAEDFNTAITLHSMGALPAMSGYTGQNDAALSVAADIPPEGRRPLMNTPIGLYRMPSQSDQLKRATQAQKLADVGEYGKAYATASGKAAGENENAVEIDFGAAGKVRVPRGQVVNALKVQQDLKANKYSAHTFQKDDSGNTVFVGIPQNGGEPVKIPLGAIGTTKAGDKSIPDFDVRVKGLMDKWRADTYAAYGITQAEFEAAKEPAQGGLFGGGSNPAATRIRQAEDTLYKRAVDSLKNSAKAGVQTKGTAVTGAKQPVPASTLPSLLAHPKVKARGIRDINALRKDLVKNGYTIIENQ